MNKILLFLFLIPANLLAQPLLWSKESMDRQKTDPTGIPYIDIIRQADNTCRTRPVAVTDKEVTRSGNKHNFEALSIYYWQNPDNPQGPYIVKDGVPNPEIKKYDLPRLAQLKANLTNLSQAYFLTQDSKYYEAYLLQLDTWFINKATRMTPHFEYNQFIPGRNNGKGCSAGIIDAYHFVDVIESIYLVNTVHPIGNKRMKRIKKWFRSFAKWMQTSEIGIGEAKATNNHGTSYDVTLFAISYFIGDNDLCNQITRNFAALRINPQIQPDGKQPLELSRTKGFYYSIYNLQHMVDFCLMQRTLGNDYINGDGKRIKTALNYLKQYIGHQKEFPYQEIGNWSDEEKDLKEMLKKIQ